MHDIAGSASDSLRDIAQEVSELQLIQAEIPIMKTSRCAWNFVPKAVEEGGKRGTKGKHLC